MSNKAEIKNWILYLMWSIYGFFLDKPVGLQNLQQKSQQIRKT